MLTCKELTELLTDYLEGALPFMQRMSLHLHLMMCKHCRAYVRQMKLTLKTVGKLPAEPIPEEVRRRLLAHYRQRTGSRPPPGECSGK